LSKPDARRFGARRIGHSLFTLTAFLLVGSMGCWEQWSDTWFPQMKRQKAIQAFEEVTFNNQIAPFMPPEGVVDIDPGEAPFPMTSSQMGPLGGVLPIAGPASIAKVRSDGHIWATIRYGRRRMPSYQRIPEESRWDVVNYVRYMNDQKGVGQ